MLNDALIIVGGFADTWKMGRRICNFRALSISIASLFFLALNGAAEPSGLAVAGLARRRQLRRTRALGSTQ
jgi:hypothetical protein